MVYFGDYINVEQKRYGVENEMYLHKVIGTKKSNTWMDVPAIQHEGMKIHDHIEDVVCCIVCGVCEEKVVRYRLKDVQFVKRDIPDPDGIEDVLGGWQPGSPKKDDIIIEGGCANCGVEYHIHSKAD